jgi:hypothetical protein
MILILFLVLGLAAITSQQRYFDALSAAGVDVANRAEFANRMMAQPGSLVPLVARETRKRLRLLFRQRPEADLERRRLTAVAWTAAALLVIAGMSVAPYWR